MAYAVHACLDPVLDAGVRSLWDRLRSLGIETPARWGFTPHISLALAEDVDLDPLADAVEALVEHDTPIEVVLGSFGAFGSDSACVSFLAPVLDPTLVRLHQQLHTTVLPGLVRGLDAHYRPGSWVPHCTLSEKAEAAVVARAASVILGAGAVPMAGRLVSIQIVRYRPAEALHTFPLGGA